MGPHTLSIFVRMLWTPSVELLRLQEEHLADDISLDPVMEKWSGAAIAAYFESGGAIRPDAVECLPPRGKGPDEPDLDLCAFLSACDLESLREALAGSFLDAWCKALDSGRPALLAHLKEAGVVALADRQKLANQLCKTRREGGLGSQTSSASLPGAAGAPSAPATEGETAASARRRALAPLPPHRRLGGSALGARGSAQPASGEWFGLPIPRTFTELASEPDGFGAGWLTRGMRAAHVLDASNSVLHILDIDELPLQGDEAQGGAAIKAILRVEYARPSPELHTSLFCKLPWPVSDHPHANPRWRAMLSTVYGDGDGRELSIYVLAEDLLPVRVPKLYFADLSRATSDYVLLCECIPYGAEDASRPGLPLLPKAGKYQDDRLLNSHDYYYALFRALARVAAADMCGRFDPVLQCFAGGAPAAVSSDTPARRETARRWARDQCGALREFATEVAPGLFPSRLCSEAFLDELERKLGDCAPYFDAVKSFTARDPAYSALAHPNLQVDNAFFWRDPDASGRLEAGLLDWYGCARAPLAAVMLGSLSGAEPSVLIAHLGPLVQCFVTEYEREGGPRIDAATLLLQVLLLFVYTMVGSLTFIATDIYHEGPSRADWATVQSRDDPRVMGRWNVRCRTIAILQQLAFWDAVDLHALYVRFGRDWDAHRPVRLDGVQLEGKLS